MSFALFLEVTIVGLILSADSFSAAVAMGMRPFSRNDALKFAASSGSAEALVAWIGATAGSQIISRFAAIDHWIAFGLLALIAAHMAWEGIQELRNPSDSQETLKFHGFAKILLVSLATSLDAFGVGMGLGISGKPILPFVLSIGFWAFTTTLLGLLLAKKLSKRFGPVIHLIGAAVLGALAVQMLSI